MYEILKILKKHILGVSFSIFVIVFSIYTIFSSFRISNEAVNTYKPKNITVITEDEEVDKVKSTIINYHKIQIDSFNKLKDMGIQNVIDDSSIKMQNLLINYHKYIETIKYVKENNLYVIDTYKHNYEYDFIDINIYDNIAEVEVSIDIDSKLPYPIFIYKGSNYFRLIKSNNQWLIYDFDNGVDHKSYKLHPFSINPYSNKQIYDDLDKMFIYTTTEYVNSDNYTNEYNREKALAYALKYAVDKNDKYYDFTPNGGDCQNFVSQVIRAGFNGIDNKVSIKEKQGMDKLNWYYQYENKVSSSWVNVNAFYDYAVKKKYKRKVVAIEVNSYKELEVGDVILFDYDDNGLYDHAVVLINPNKAIFAHHATYSGDGFRYLHDFYLLSSDIKFIKILHYKVK